jgi:hypothetical protein
LLKDAELRAAELACATTQHNVGSSRCSFASVLWSTVVTSVSAFHRWVSEATWLFHPSFRMQRCILLDKIGHRLWLILDDVVHAAADHPGIDMSASICAETFGNLWNQLCKR